MQVCNNAQNSWEDQSPAALIQQDQVTGSSRPLMPQKDLTANILPETSCGSSCSGGTKLAGLKNKASVIMKIQIPASAVGDNQRGIHLKHSCRS